MNNTNALVFSLAALGLACIPVVAAPSSAAAVEPTTFSVSVTGHGRPMILIPGLACPGDVWDATVTHFADRYECHVLSLAGFGGATAATPDGPLLERVRDELADYIRTHDLAPPIIIGHSLGGFIALDLAAHHPALPGRLVLVDSLPFVMDVMRPGATAEDAKQAAAATAGAFAAMDNARYAQMIRSGPNGSTMAAGEDDVARIIAWGLASDPATVVQAMTEMYTRDLRGELGAVACPTLALASWVGYAPYSSHEYVEKTYRAQYGKLHAFDLAITDTARHFIMFDEPAWTFTQIEAFLAAPAP